MANTLPANLHATLNLGIGFFIGVESADYTIDSLLVCERQINELYPLGHNPMATTVIMFGLYLGEVLVRNVPGAEWNIDTSDPDTIMGAEVRFKHIKGEFGAYPMTRVKNFWFDRTDTLYGWTVMLRDLATGELDPTALPKGWQPYKGSKIRVTQVKMED